MEGHLLKSKLPRSQKWKQVKGDFPRLVYTLLIACVDSWGMMPADGITLKSNLGPFDRHTADDYSKALRELERVDLVRVWEEQGDPWLYVTGHDIEQVRGIRKRKSNPEVRRPKWVLEPSKNRLGRDQEPTKMVPGTDQVASKNRYEVEVEVEEEVELETDIDQFGLVFEDFWSAYPRKVGKGAARKVWDKIRPTQELIQTILDAIQLQRQSQQWQKDGGQFIPHPATWLNQERWMDNPNIEADQTYTAGDPKNVATLRKYVERAYNESRIQDGNCQGNFPNGRSPTGQDN